MFGNSGITAAKLRNLQGLAFVLRQNPASSLKNYFRLLRRLSVERVMPR